MCQVVLSFHTIKLHRPMQVNVNMQVNANESNVESTDLELCYHFVITSEKTFSTEDAKNIF